MTKQELEQKIEELENKLLQHKSLDKREKDLKSIWHGYNVKKVELQRDAERRYSERLENFLCSFAESATGSGVRG